MRTGSRNAGTNNSPYQGVNRRTCALLWLRNSLLFVFLGCVFCSCENNQEEVKRITQVNTEPLETIKGLETFYSDSGRVKVRVMAPELLKKTHPEPVTELPKGVNIDFYDQDMKVEARLTSCYAIHHENERKWEAKNDVVVVNQKGEQLNTELLVWDERAEKLISNEQVKITTREEIIYGRGFEANQDFSRYKIFNVSGRITVKK